MTKQQLWNCLDLHDVTSSHTIYLAEDMRLNPQPDLQYNSAVPSVGSQPNQFQESPGACRARRWGGSAGSSTPEEGGRKSGQHFIEIHE